MTNDVANAKAVTDGLASSLDIGWTLIAGILVFFMQAGFSLLEAGSVRNKNTLNILMKNVIDTSVGAVGWFLLGYGIAFGADNSETGSGGVIGTSDFLVTHNVLKTKEDGSTKYPAWFFQFTFCATAATIVSGALAERCKLEGYCIFSLVMSLIIYPIVVHWTWGSGFLSEWGYSDFAGSGVVHLTGGISALIGAVILGPRSGRFNEEMVDRSEFAPSSTLNICVGTFILWFGWYGFNAGSTTMLSGNNAEVAAHCCVTTTLAAACGGLTGFFLQSYKTKIYDVSAFANGILGGLVGITAGCSNVDTWAAVVIGIFAGVFCVMSMWMLEALKIDDPISAYPVHGACGIWGVIANGLFDLDNGWFYSGDFSAMCGPNIAGVCFIIIWCLITTGLLFTTLNKFGLLRVDLETEIKGLDSEFCPQRVSHSKDCSPMNQNQFSLNKHNDPVLEAANKIALDV